MSSELDVMQLSTRKGVIEGFRRGMETEDMMKVLVPLMGARGAKNHIRGALDWENRRRLIEELRNAAKNSQS